ncbi:uncharacterized protein LOC111377935 [Olea europaea var. sylvestris]|uniref:uncharacterized protein LOC111377935 n=1 Tax=Olea europaea var. sylvestris TaxID=158386 RepID=UPI000C1D4906|nr:uncharacterized protein LOC111377935 [Olea europaea var. sylvestris]
MQPPPGYTTAPTNKVYRLRRSLYGLKQASRQWNTELSLKLIEHGFVQSNHDHCLFLKHSSDHSLFLLIYVDDVLITRTYESDIISVKKYLHSQFTVKDIGVAKYFQGLEIARGEKGTYVNQRKYILDIIKYVGLIGARSVSVPIPKGTKLSQISSPPFADLERYRRLIGRLLYLNLTRPDITYGIQQLSQFVHSPCQIHWDTAIHLLRYLKGCPSLGLYFPVQQNFTLAAYSDADWASCSDTRRSLTGFCVYLGDTLISWKTKKQTTVSRSTAEAEYRSLATTVCEVTWINYILKDFAITIPLPIPLWCDNKSALHICANPVFHERTKHLEIDCHIVINKFKGGFVLPQHISSSQQVADIFTKALAAPQFHHLVSKLGLGDLHQLPA